METTTEKKIPEIDEIVTEVKSYINTSMDLYKMKAAQQGATLASGAIIHLIIIIFFTMVLLFVSLAVALFLSNYFNKMYLGFLIVGGFYTVVSLLLYLSKDKWLKNSLVDGIIKAFYSN